MAPGPSRWRAVSSSIIRSDLARWWLSRLMQLKTILALVPIACLVASPAAAPAFALPPPSSSFHGTIKADGQNVEEGSFIIALINGDAYASTFTEIDQQNSVYFLEVPGDDPDTPEIDGGREGDTVQFEFVGVLADQTGTWHSDTDVELNLTVSGFEAPATPTPTPTLQPTPTRTPGPTAQVSPTPTQTPTPTVQPSRTPTRTSLGSPSPTNTALPTPTLTPALNQQPPQVSTPSPVPAQTLVSTTRPGAATTSPPVSPLTPISTGQPSSTGLPSPLPTGTVGSNRQPLPTRMLSPYFGESSPRDTRLAGLVLIMVAIGVVLVTAGGIAVWAVICAVRQDK